MGQTILLKDKGLEGAVCDENPFPVKLISGSNVLDITTAGETAGTENLVMMGVDSGGLARMIATDTSGHLQVDILSGSGGTQYTEGDTDASITGRAIMWEDTSDTLRAVSATKPLPIDVISSALPTGAATAANQLPDGHNVTIDNAIGAAAVNIRDGGNSITVDGTFWQTTQPVSGTFWQATQPVSIAAAVDTELTTADLDTGAGTDTRAVVGLVLEASGGGLLVGAANPMPISDNAGSITVDGTFWQATQPVSGTFWQATQPISAASLPLPTGAATSAKQLADGHNVTVDNAVGAAAVNIQDGGNVITVNATDLDIRNLGASDVPDLSDRAARLLGKIYGNQDVLQQRATTKEALVQISHQGAEKDPTQIRALTLADIVTIADISKVATLYTVACTAAGNNLIRTPAAGKKIRVRLLYVANDGTGAKMPAFRFAAAGTIHCYTPTVPNQVVAVNLVNSVWEGGVNESLYCWYSGSAYSTIWVTAFIDEV